jgi:translocation and assembly module TamB
MPHHLPAQPLRTALSLLMPLGAMVALLLLVLGTAVGAARWLLLEEDGSRWLLQRIPGVQVTGWQGTLLGPQWAADSLRVQIPGEPEWVQLQGLKAQGLHFAWRPNPQAWLGITVQQLSAQRVQVDTGPPGTRPLPLPASIAGPVQLSVQNLSVAELVVDDMSPVQHLSALGLEIDARTGGQHQVQSASAQWLGLQLTANGHIGNTAPLPVELQASARPLADGDAPRWAAVAQLQGGLSALQLRGTLRGRPQVGMQVPVPARPSSAGALGPAVDVSATLRVLQEWPLAALDLQTQALDLAALWPQAPQTQFSGSVLLSNPSKAAPVQAIVALSNGLPGRWNEGRLPVGRISGQLTGSLAQTNRLDFSGVEVLFADAGGSAGRWTGNAQWQDHRLQLQTEVDGLRPQQLDGRAARMQLSGPLSATISGLPSPDPRAAAPAGSPQASFKADLTGSAEHTPQPVRVALEGSASAQRVELSRATAQSGNASADLRVLLFRAPAATAVGKADTGPRTRQADSTPRSWQLETTGTLKDFEPLPWWPGEAGSTWRKGPHRLSAQWMLDLRLPQPGAATAPLEWAQRVAGNGSIKIFDAVLAGVPFGADLTLAYRPTAAAQAQAPSSAVAKPPPAPTGPPTTLHAELRAAGNTLVVDGTGDPTGNGQSDRLRMDLQAPQLAALAPWARLFPEASNWLPQQGAASATVAADGRWPRLRTEGFVRLSELRVGSTSVAQGNAAWAFDTSGGAQPLSLKLELAGLQTGAPGKEQRADHLRADLRGTLAEHRIELSGATPAAPPAELLEVLGVKADSGTRMLVQAQGSWTGANAVAAGGTWRGQVQRVLLGAWDGSAATAPPAVGWIDAQNLRAALEFDGQGKLVALSADPGRVTLGSDLVMRWDAIRVDLRPANVLVQLRADIDPFSVVPLLQRLQPDMNWRGDLKLAAKLDIQAGERFDADMVFERRSGDLQVQNDDGLQSLGLADLRLALSAHDGVWQFTPVMSGRVLGEIAGSVRAVTGAERRWPHADAPIEGALTARVADIGIWGSFVPPGWRLTGQARTTLTLGGRFGQPQYTGDLSGSGLGVRNLLQGVNVSDGQLAVRLAGDTATVERATLRGGDGLITVTGGATLGKAPELQLQFKAERFRVLGRVDRLVIASGNATLVMQPNQGRLDGSFKIDEGLFDTSAADAPSLDDDVNVRRPGVAAAASTDATAPRARRPFSMAVNVDMGPQLRVRGRGLDTLLRGQLRLTTPGNRLAVTGTINTESGTYAAYGQKLEIERGIIAFSGPVDNPRLDVLALRPNIDTRVGVSITGNLLTTRVRLYADPEMSDTDKLSWLVLGRAPDGLGRADTALLQRAAVALLAGEGEAPTDAFMKTLGIDELSLRQGEGEVRDTVITLGKQLSRRWYLGYERGVNATTGTWQLIYRIAQRFTVRAQSGLENSLDMIWVWRVQETPADASMRKSTVNPP